MAEEMTFDANDPRMIQHLYSENLRMSAKLETLSNLISYILDKHGFPIEMHDNLFNELDQENYDHILSQDPLLDHWWNEKLDSELGDIPGLQL